MYGVKRIGTNETDDRETSESAGCEDLACWEEVRYKIKKGVLERIELAVRIGNQRLIKKLCLTGMRN